MKHFRIIPLLLASALMMGACSTENQSGSSKGEVESSKNPPSSAVSVDTPETQEVFEITMMQELFSAQPPDLNSEWFQRLTEETGVRLEVNFIPTGDPYKDKTNVLIASNDLPMVVALNSGQIKSSAVVSGIDNGMFWVIGDYLDDYPVLKDFVGESVWSNARINGLNVGMPRLRVLPRNGWFYRKDWADKLGINPPETLEEIYAMAKAFTEDDPDGNGQADTWGMELGYASTGNTGWNGLQGICVAMGGPNTWRYENGSMMPDFLTDEYMTALDFYRDLYADGYMNKDFAILTGNKRVDVFNQGNAGMMFGVLEMSFEIQEKLSQVVPTAEMAVAPVIKGPQGQQLLNSTDGFNGQLVFTKTGKGAIEGEEDLRRVLSFYEQMCGDDMQEFFFFGSEGIDYNLVDGKKEMITKADGMLQLTDSQGDIGQLLPSLPFINRDSDDKYRKAVWQSFNERGDLIVLNDATPLTSDTQTEYGGELDKIVMDAGVKYIMGEIDKSGYDAEMEVWKSRGGNDVIKELTEQYELYN